MTNLYYSQTVPFEQSSHGHPGDPFIKANPFALDGWFNAGAYQQGAAGTGFKFRGEFDWFSGRDHEGKFFDNWSCHSYSRALRKAWFVHIHPISTLFLSTFCRCICFKHWPGLLVLHGDSTCTHSTASSTAPRPTMGYPPSWCHPSCRWKAAPFAELPLLPGIPGDLIEWRMED